NGFTRMLCISSAIWSTNRRGLHTLLTGGSTALISCVLHTLRPESVFVIVCCDTLICFDRVFWSNASTTCFVFLLIATYFFPVILDSFLFRSLCIKIHVDFE